MSDDASTKTKQTKRKKKTPTTTKNQQNQRTTRSPLALGSLFCSCSLSCEYFQWSPVYNYDSPSFSVNSGDILHGTVVYDKATHSYTMTQTDLTTGDSSTGTIKIQGNKNYTIMVSRRKGKPDGEEIKTTLTLMLAFRKLCVCARAHTQYVVQEKVCDCDAYSADGQVTFYDIVLEFDNKRVKPLWTTSYVDDNCNTRAHVVNTSTIQITWDTRFARHRVRVLFQKKK